jgi:hypothetical protein
MKRILLSLVIAVGAFMTSAPAFAHHSFAATYFEDRHVTIHGKIVQFLFRNPHSFVHISGEDDKGAVVLYAVEWAGAGQLSRDGVNAASLHPWKGVIQ